jgi:hypothetical protein
MQGHACRLTSCNSFMVNLPAPSESPPHADEVNRLWQHGLHEERLFHDRLNYFSASFIVRPAWPFIISSFPDTPFGRNDGVKSIIPKDLRCANDG